MDIICGKQGPALPEPPGKKPPLVRIFKEKEGGSAAQKGRRAVAQAAKYKSPLDDFFLADPHCHWAETFVLRWEGPLLNLDFRSMYPACLLSGFFHHPAKLQTSKGNHTEKILDGEINQGIFRCKIKPTEENWARNHHYLRYRQNGKSHHFHWKKDHMVETLLHADDIFTLYEAGFHIETLWGIFDPNDEPYQHPAAKLVQEELEAKYNGDLRAKDRLLRLCTDKPRRHFHQEKSQLTSMAITGTPPLKKIWYGPNPACAHSLYSPIRAAARTKVWRLARSLSDPNKNPWAGELLRVHTDGLSIGFKSKSHRQKALEHLLENNEFLVGEKPGCLKITEADGGFFLSQTTWWEHAITPEGKFITYWPGKNPNPFDTQIPYRKRDGSIGIINMLKLRETGKWLDRKAKPFPKWRRKPPGSHPAKEQTPQRYEIKELEKYKKSFQTQT